ncbi:MAG: hypothetical protein K5922_09960, partial [Clostridiales bacterium]|nr:hypothetical protein [Clostridiales bacterium]
MKKNYTRLWIPAVFLILTVLCLTAAGADDLWEYRVEDGFAWLTGYNGAEESITVPDQIDGIPVVGLSTAAIGNSVRDVTIPVAVSEIAPEAITAGTRVHARHGAAALSWAREHQCAAIDLSKRDFNELIVDLTGSDYQYSPNGISLSPALGRAVHAGQAVYIPETDSAWGISALTEQNGRILLTAEEADPYMTYNSVRIRSATKRGASGDGLSFDEHGHAIISFSPEANYHFSLPIQQDNVVVTQNLDITQLDVNMEVSMGTVIAASSPALLPALIGWNIRDIVTTGGEHTLDLGSLVKRADIDFQWTISTDITISAAGFTLLPDQAIVLEAQLDFTRQIPLGPTPFTLKPFGLLQASANGSYSMTFGIENNRFSMSYTCTNWNGNLSGEGFSFGTPFIESNTVVEATAGIFFGLELGMKPCMSLLTLTAGVEASLSDERAEIENRIGTTFCRDVTWDIYQKGNVTFQPEIDFEIFSSGPGKISVYVQNSIDLTKGFSIGLQYGSNFSGFASWDFAKKRWNIPIIISGHEIQAGETAHYEMEESGNWVYREHCQRDHLLAFHTGNPDEEVIYKDCSSFRDWYQFSDTNWTPEQVGKTFQGWYTEAGENFYDENSAYTDITAWAGQLDLYASWQDNSTG